MWLCEKRNQERKKSTFDKDTIYNFIRQRRLGVGTRQYRRISWLSEPEFKERITMVRRMNYNNDDDRNIISISLRVNVQLRYPAISSYKITNGRARERETERIIELVQLMD
jgi:hypothetical protein